MTELSSLLRKRLDVEHLPGGGVRAVLTVSLAGGRVERYVADIEGDGNEVGGNPVQFVVAVKKLKADVDAGKYGSGPSARAAVLAEIERLKKKYMTGGINLKKVGAAVGKVMAVAAKGLTLAAVVLPPPANAAAALGAGVMAVGSKLTAAAVSGKPAQAAGIVADAATDAARLTKSAAGARELLDEANEVRKGGLAVATREVAAAPRGRTRVEPRRAVELARRRLRSTTPGAVSVSELEGAARGGRVFVVG